MVGAIRKRDILAHPMLTVHCFGWRVFFRALTAGRNATFLSIVTQAAIRRQPSVKVPESVGQCIDLEFKARQIYESLARRFAQQEPVKRFFEMLAQQEQDHAELLELCWTAAGPGRWDSQYFEPWREAIPQLKRQMEKAASSLDSLDGVRVALRLVIQIESSEVNQVFRGVVAATDSDFVRKLQAFQQSTSYHLGYICEQISKLEPDLEGECQEMMAAYELTVDSSG
jgi:hypothetical protein